MEFFKAAKPAAGLRHFIRLLCVFALLCLSAGTVLFYRKPVILVNDRVFLDLYGERRTRIEGILSSLRLFRRVLPVYVAPEAGPDLVSLAAASAAGKSYSGPCAVVFPYRFRDGAGRFFRTYPDIPVVVLGGNIESGFEAGETGAIRLVRDGPARFGADLLTDFYRAGSMAALCARGGPGKGGPRDQGGNSPASEVLFFGDFSQNGGEISAGEREAFERGLSEQGFSGASRYIRSDSDFTPGGSLPGCVVVRDGGVSYLEAFPGPEMPPVLLFSWIDPAAVPAETLAVFDDSPWALLVPLIGLLEKGEVRGLIPSRIRILDQKNRSELVKKLKKLNFTGFQADN
ncbi:MAG: hypothetical protein LBQ44_08805 [Treponema sp.]|nr:hypothetical protein [Treponema sp.]